MTFHPYGDRAVLINFEQRIEESINMHVIALHRALQTSAVPGISFYIPAYCSLTVGYNPDRIHYKQLCREISTIAQTLIADASPYKGNTLHIPVCYDKMFAPDADEVSRQTGLSIQEIVQLHTTTVFRVFMLGFLPGFPYMGRLPEALYCSRKPKPQLKVPASSVGLAGYQTGIYPSAAPGGWQLIGKTPLKLFDAEKEAPFLLQPGDRVKFYSISHTSFQHIKNDIVSGNFNINSRYE